MNDITMVCGQCAGKGCSGCNWSGTVTMIED